MLQIFKTVESEQIFDKGRSVIISTPPENKDRRYSLIYNNDGTFSILTKIQVGLTTLKIVGHNLALLKINPEIKMSIPMGLKLQVIEPKNPSHYDRINVEYDEYDSVTSNGESDDILDKRIPESKLIIEPKIIIYADINRYRQTKTAAAINVDKPLVDIYFHYIAVPGRSHPPEVDTFILTQDEEFYKSFIERI